MGYAYAPPAYGAGAGAGGAADPQITLNQLYAVNPQLRNVIQPRLYGAAGQVPNVNYQGQLQNVPPAYAALAGGANGVPTLDSQGNTVNTPAPTAAVASVGSALGGIGSALGIGGGKSSDPTSQYTPDQLKSQGIAADAAEAAYKGITRGVLPSGAVVFDRNEQRLPPPQSVLGAQVGARPDLYANANPFLMQGGQQAGAAATGALGAQLGSTADLMNRATGQFDANVLSQSGNAARGQQSGALSNAAGQAITSATDLGGIRLAAAGQGPSAAQNLAQSQLDASVRAQAAQAAAARGGNVAAANRQAAISGTDARLQSAAQNAALRAQEQATAQQLLTQGNAAVGSQLQGLAGQYGVMRSADIGRDVATAGALNDASKTAAANFGINAQLAGQGIGALNQAGAEFGSQNLGAQQFEAQNAGNYANWLQNQFSLAMGIPVQYGAQQTQRDIANQQNQTLREGAYANAGAGILTGLLF